MKFIICLALFLTPFTNIESSVVIYRKDSGRCKDVIDRTMHKIGSKWRNSNCQLCKCFHTVVACWDSYSIPSNYPTDCVASFERQSCRYRVHKRNNPSVECPVWPVGRKYNMIAM